MRRRRILLVFAAVAAALLVATLGAEQPEDDTPAAPLLRFAHGTLTPAGTSRVRTSAWWGGRYSTATGEQVSVYLSASYPQDESVARRWAEYFASLVHRDELGSVTVNVAPLAEVQELCGGQALGCYGADRLVMMGEDLAGITATQVAAHEYGHHVAAHRANPPWRAVDWGTKRWATTLGVCPQVAAGALFPGDQGSGYRLNPGEGFAESYRLMNERRTDPTASSWPVVSASLFPSADALAAAEKDVVQPWSAPKATVRRGRFSAGRPRAWTLRLATPLDGDLRVTLDLPPVTPYRLTVVGADGRRLAPGVWTSSTRQVASATICGTRSVLVRVERRGPPARFVLRASIP